MKILRQALPMTFREILTDNNYLPTRKFDGFHLQRQRPMLLAMSSLSKRPFSYSFCFRLHSANFYSYEGPYPSRQAPSVKVKFFFLTLNGEDIASLIGPSTGLIKPRVIANERRESHIVELNCGGSVCSYKETRL